MSNDEQVFGIHAVQSLLKTSAHRLKELYIYRGRRDQKVQKILDAVAAINGVVKYVEKKDLDALCDGNHQGVVALVKAGKNLIEADLYELVQTPDIVPLVLVLDGVTDPHNLGACLRSADAAGVHAVVIPKDNSVGLNETARKVASGAAETTPLIAVTNLARCLKKLQELGLWVTGLAGEATDSTYDSDLTGPRVIVMGAEGSGMRRLTKETCDVLVKIPMHGSVSSLNVSVATGVVLFETLRQRSLSSEA
ncbi:23S rRNA (guanosine(2251)-2'-O)-methyltransferase RlmB [Agarilytica rhodophyticola]|uniref:23S rRNA (guanosine(2251)-2'-O)-methyltransferase RlmB n=1 Tax=Agarilytica rhodophyticola TaxID=1737490 RepID=UPI000B349DBD|nr:23S rRNA (guanosine(2251)-2'-O)-methyltransferase RlmB [Agarilytica rhodophyticola]